MLVLFERCAERLDQVDAQVVGQQHNNKEDVTELICNRAAGVFGGAGLVAEFEVELATKLADLFGEPGVLGQGRPVPSPLLDPGVETLLEGGEVCWYRRTFCHRPEPG